MRFSKAPLRAPVFDLAAGQPAAESSMQGVRTDTLLADLQLLS